MNVSEIMSPDPITLSPQAPLREAAELMIRNDIHELPITEGAQVSGIITRRDLSSWLGPELEGTEAQMDMPVGEAMSSDVMVLGMDSTFSEACRTLAQQRVGAMPVVNGSLELVGIVSVTDLLMAAARLYEESM